MELLSLTCAQLARTLRQYKTNRLSERAFFSVLVFNSVISAENAVCAAKSGKYKPTDMARDGHNDYGELGGWARR